MPGAYQASQRQQTPYRQTALLCRMLCHPLSVPVPLSMIVAVLI
jgi:hypothetical protein